MIAFIVAYDAKWVQWHATACIG